MVFGRLKGFFKKGERKGYESCMPEFNVTDTPLMPRVIAPDEFATKIIVAGGLNQSKATAKAVMQVQKELATLVKKDFADTKLLMSVETFLDGCRHSTDWSSKPTNAGSEWHCDQSNTQFSEAFNAMRKGSQEVDVVIIIGDRFDDDFEKTMAETQGLYEERGTKFFAMPTTTEASVVRAYGGIAQSSGGLMIPHFTNGSYGDLVKEIVQASLFKSSGKDLSALPAPDSDTAKDIRLMLKEL